MSNEKLTTGVRLAVVFFSLNFAWEVLQIPLYTMWWTDSSSRIASALIHCVLGDLLIGALAFAAALALVGGGWPEDRLARIRVAMFTTLAGVSYTVLSEWINVEIRHTWAYTETMPRLPPLGTGLTPVLQWLLLPGIALAFITRAVAQKISKNPRESADRKTTADRL